MLDSKALTRIQLIILIVVIFFAGIVSSALVLLNQDELTESIDTKIQSLMEKGDIPSLAVGIIINDTMVWSQGYGEQSDINTVYIIGSVTKMFTATAIMQLVENNKLDLDADINTYIPFSVRNPNQPNTPITARMLLTHRSGISEDGYSEYQWGFDTETLTWANNNLGTNFTIWETSPTLRKYLDETLNPSGKYYREFYIYYPNNSIGDVTFYVEIVSDVTNGSNESYFDLHYNAVYPESELENEKSYVISVMTKVTKICKLTIDWSSAHWSVWYQD